MQENKPFNHFIIILKISSITVLLGRAWQFLFLDAPYRALLWDESFMTATVKSVFGMEWQAWVSSKVVDHNIQLSIMLTGAIFFIGSLLVLFINKNRRWIDPILWLCCLLLFTLAYLQTKEKFYHIGQFFEHASQVGVLAILIWSIRDRFEDKTIHFMIKVMIALTFSCHGLYAINYYPRPGIFVDMVINTFGTSESFAHTFILIAGILDIIIAISIFIPRVSRIALWYAVIWGIITAIVRVTSNLYTDFFLQSLHQSLYLGVYRLIHGLLPLSLLALQSWGFTKVKAQKT